MLDIRHLHSQIIDNHGNGSSSSRSTPRIHIDQSPQSGPQSSSKSSLQRPLGRPTSDLSMYYDKNFFFPPATGKKKESIGGRGARGRGGVNGQRRRPATVIPCLTENNDEVARRSWPQIGDAWQPVVSQQNSKNSRDLCTPQLAAYTVSDQRYKVGINNRPQTHDIASLPSFKTQLRTGGEPPPARPQSEPVVCKLPIMTKIRSSSFQRQDKLRFAGDGFAVRHSTYRSLANNPNLKVENVNGRVTISRRRRAKSLPPKLHEKQLESPRPRNDNITLTGWHRRSRSPTFTTLAQAKDHLDAALSRKLWEIRRHIDGQRARENSAVFSELSSAKSNPDKNVEEWYERMLREHSDEDLAAIETLCIANYDDQLMSTESIDIVTPKPKVDFHFDKNYLKTHINDWNILGLMQEEERKRVMKEMRKSKRDAGRPPPADQIGAKTKSYIKQIVAPKSYRKQHMSTSVMPKAEPVPEESPSIKHTPIVVPMEEPVACKLETPVKEVIASTSKPPAPLASKSSEDVVAKKTSEDLVAKYLGNREPIVEYPPEEKIHRNKVLESLEDKESLREQPEEATDKKLSEKEKFLLMRKRMDDIKAEKAKNREKGVGDYVRLGMSVKKGANNFLGSLMSSRLEKMTTFKSKTGKDEADDDDDDYGSDDDSDGD